MAKHRLIFALLLNNGSYMLSRNFSLQTVGDLRWIKEHYNFNAIAHSIDELIVLNVERENKDVKAFARDLAELTKNCFMPITAGGGIRSLEDAFAILDAGADKLIVNSVLIDDPQFVTQLVRTFGSQCIVVSIDYREVSGRNEVFISDGSKATGKTVGEAAKIAQELGCGELFLTSIDRDGTGEGLDLGMVRRIASVVTIPVIASGGVGKYDHFAQGIIEGRAEAVSSANLFNFIEDGLTEARLAMKKNGIDMACWNFNFTNEKLNPELSETVSGEKSG